ncbi:MAG: LacI family DNA-binding transcriptional regulator [Propioniciclava sp.]|uniref:LacI family DNA-binding transcriptional regulator n=1 Tax=Propioniciclava sp. TaxID=2038686 RepID=UPI0039E5A5F5
MGDVARLAGVSTQTVSRVVNGEPYVTEPKKDAVLAAMRELGYRPNAAARAMKRGDFKTIGVLYRTLRSVGNRKALEGIVDAAAAHGYSTVLIPTTTTRSSYPPGALEQSSIDVAIVIVSSSLGGDVEVPPYLPVPTVVLSSGAPERASSVSIDETSGAREVVAHLLGLGHRTVHHLAGPERSIPARARENAWREALIEAGCPVPEVVRGDWSAESGYEATRALLATQRPTALFAGNDQMALGAYRALFEAGLRIPEDVSVVGCDNIDESVSFPPPLTTLLMDWDLIGRQALQAALGMLDDPTPSTLTIPSTLIVRASTGPAPAP